METRRGLQNPTRPNPNSWPLGELVYETEFATNASGQHQSLDRTWRPACIAASLETKDRFGKSVTAELPLQVLDPEAKKLNLKLPNLYAAPKTSLQPGEEYTADLGKRIRLGARVHRSRTSRQAAAELLDRAGEQRKQ